MMTAPSPVVEAGWPTAGAAVRAVERELAAAGIASPRLDALLLVAHALGVDADAVRLAPDRPLDAAARARLRGLVARRAVAREPVSRIVGLREFWSLPFRLSADTLDPRPDSECLVEAALRRIPDRSAPLKLLDLGTGSGCLLLALLSELPNAQGLGVDLAPGAVATAQANAAALGLADRARFRVGDWGAEIDDRFHWILCNPPYINSEAIDRLPAEVGHDPRLALDGGRDGLDAYRAIAAQLPGLLAEEGWAAIEIDDGQAVAVSGLLADHATPVAATEFDLAGRRRCVVIRATSRAASRDKKAVAPARLTC